ncbi:MAG: 50S ribosomal protein L31 [Patescibacteria group bacterium]|jgi:large subunit ribosomal protein L31
MKNNIHPKYFEKTKITCACGNSIEVGSTVSELHLDVCSACHPFFTGNQKFIDTAGRVDKFRERMAKAKEMREAKSKKIKPAVTEDKTESK